MAQQLGNNYYNSPFKFNGKELDEETGLYYYGARYYDPKISLWLSVDPLAEVNPHKSPYNYCSNNPVSRVDPTGMIDGDHTEVTKNEDGSYTVVGGKADNDKNIYVVDKNGKRTGNIIGQSLTTHSFHDENGNAINGAIINDADTSGINFLNLEIINNKKLSIWDYMPNATGGEKYDFKARGINDRPEGMSSEQYRYRGMLFLGVDGFNEAEKRQTTIFASARDFGNVAAGYVAGNAGLPWGASRIGFDGLQSWQEKWFATEGQPTKLAQRIGHDVGWSAFVKRYQNELKKILETKAKNPLLGPK